MNLDPWLRMLTQLRNKLPLIPPIYPCIAGILMLPIILHVPRYIDDYRRSIVGEFWLARLGRPLAELLLRVLSFGGTAIGVSPLLQLAALPIIAFVMAVCATSYGIKSPWIGVLATLPLFFFPYFLENLSYGFDCLPMVLSQGIALLAAVLMMRVRNLGPGVLIAAFTMLLAVLMLYQASLSSFLAFLLTGWVLQRVWPDHSIDSFSRQASSLSRLMISIGVYISAIVVYRMMLGIHIIQLGKWEQKMSALLPLTSELPLLIAGRMIELWRLLGRDWSATGLPMLLVIQIVGILLILGFRSAPRLALALVAILMITTVSLGPQFMLINIFGTGENAYPELPARMMVFVGPVLASFNLTILRVGSPSRTSSASRLAAVVFVAFPLLSLAWFYTFFAYSYGYATQAQREYETGKVSRLMAYLSELEASLPGESRANAIAFKGIMPQSPSLQNVQRKLPLVGRMIPQMINNDWFWGHILLKHNGMNHLGYFRWPVRDTPELRQMCSPRARSICTSDYDVLLEGNRFFVNVK
jgi:hypothetical protein